MPAARRSDRLVGDGAARRSVVDDSRQGQVVINPLISELRLHRTTLAGLLKQLQLPDDEAPGGVLGAPRSVQTRKAAQTSWSKV